MTRLLLSMRFLTVAGAVALIACGPRLKPVEYEEPKLAGSGAPDDDSESGGNSKSRSASRSDDSSSSSSGASRKGGPFQSCDDKANTCGEPCTECEPGNMDCMEILIEKQCNLEHKCVAAPADCTPPEKSDKKKAKK